MNRQKRISIIGGAGHVGFPLGLVFGSKNFKVNLIDKNLEFLNKIGNGTTPFLEEGSEKLLKNVIKKKKYNYFNKFKRYIKIKVYYYLYWNTSFYKIKS